MHKEIGHNTTRNIDTSLLLYEICYEKYFIQKKKKKRSINLSAYKLTLQSALSIESCSSMNYFRSDIVNISARTSKEAKKSS
ncbi:unnamed protein product [Rotaria socialis]